MNRTKLTIKSLVYSQSQIESYVLVLAEEGGDRRLPIVVGVYEAQAIAIALEAMKPSRPLTHDLFLNFAEAHNIDIAQVQIVSFEEGIFRSSLTCESQAGKIIIDARTSDAVALAVRFKCPIYVSDDILDKAGIIASDLDNIEEDIMDDIMDEVYDDLGGHTEPEDLSSLDLEDLEDMLKDAIKEEDYELASQIRDEIHKRH